MIGWLNCSLKYIKYGKTSNVIPDIFLQDDWIMPDWLRNAGRSSEAVIGWLNCSLKYIKYGKTSIVILDIFLQDDWIMPD